MIGGVQKPLHFFGKDLPQSDECFVKAYPCEMAEAFLDGHVEVFAFFSGGSLQILHDNLAIAVAKISAMASACGRGRSPRRSG